MNHYTAEQHAFAVYFIEQNFKRANEAYKRAYPKCKSENAAMVSASRLLSQDKIKDLIRVEMDKILGERKQFLEHEIFNFWYKRMTYDPTEIIDVHGKLVITEEELRAKGLHVCIDSINQKLNAQGMPYTEYKLADRDKAADRLSDYIQMIKPSVQPIAALTMDAGQSGAMTPQQEETWSEFKKLFLPALDTVKKSRDDS